MYPTISEYLEAIKAAEDNFDQLKHLRPVLGDDGEPVMTSGNFAVVFKMKDGQTGKLHAVKCFLREQEGRAEAYRMIAEELEYVSSTFLTPIKYLDKELFVDTNAGNEKEFPVLLMDWVEGATLDKYIRKHLDDQYELSLLAYQFSRLAMWLMPQPFAHGDLKPDNILVKSDGTLVLVDYDGMYVPAMKGQKARELGSPDFRHPSRTETDFDEHIDDFSLASILLSLKAISLQPSLLEEYGAQDRLLFSEKDYRNLSESKVMDALKPLMQDAELTSLYSLFILAASQNNLSGVSFRLFNLNRPNNRPNVSSPKTGLRVLQIKKKIVNQSDHKIIKKELLASFQGKENVWHIVSNNGTSSYQTQGWSFVDEAYDKGADSLNTVETETKHVLFLFNDKDAEVGRYYIGKELQGLTPSQIKEIKHEIVVFESWNPEKKIWVPCVGKAKVIDEDKEYVEKYGKTKSEYLKENFNEVNTLTAVCLKKVFDYYHHYDYPELEVGKTYKVTHIGVFRSFTRIMLSGFGNKEYNSVCFEIFENGESINKKYSRDPRFEAPYLREKYHPWFSSNDSIEEENLSTIVTDDDLANAWTDEYGVKYSQDRMRLLKVPGDLDEYSVKEGTRIICDESFSWDFGNRSLKTVNIPNTVVSIGYGAFRDCEVLSYISLPDSLMTIGESSFSGCNSLISIILPKKIVHLGDRAFYNCGNLSHINIPESVLEIGTEVFSRCAFSNIIIPKTINKIGNYAFYGCKNLKRVSVPNSVEEFGVGLFGGCSSLVEAELPNTLEEFGYEFFSGCPLTHITIPNSVKKIGERAFWDSSIKNIVIPDSITKIEEGAFYGSSLEQITLPSTITEISDSTFYDCFALRHVVIPESVTRIGNNSFYGCESLSTIMLPNSIKSIGYGAFLYCNALKEITIPESVTEIEGIAFKYCESLSHITFAGIVSQLCSDAFSECDTLCIIVIPEGSKDHYEKLLPEYKNILVEKSDIKSIVFDNCIISKIEWCRVYPQNKDWLLQVVFKNGMTIEQPYSLLQGNQSILLDKQSIEKLQLYVGFCEGFYINPKAIKIDYAYPSKYIAQILFNADYVEISGITWGLNNNINDWRVKGIRSFNIEERLAVNRAEVVASDYGFSVCFFMNAGGQTYIPLDRNSELIIGDELDMNTAKLITLCRKGKSDIVRVIE